MKKLTNTFVLAGVISLVIISCGKDTLTSTTVQRPGGPGGPPTTIEPKIAAVSITGSSAELSMNVQSSDQTPTSYAITIPGLLNEEFALQHSEKKSWQLKNLSTGTYRVTVRRAESNSIPYYFAVNFEISDDNGIHKIMPSTFGNYVYVFDLEVKN